MAVVSVRTNKEETKFLKAILPFMASRFWKHRNVHFLEESKMNLMRLKWLKKWRSSIRILRRIL